MSIYLIPAVSPLRFFLPAISLPQLLLPLQTTKMYGNWYWLFLKNAPGEKAVGTERPLHDCFGSNKDMPYRWEFPGKCQIVPIMTTLRFIFWGPPNSFCPSSSYYAAVFPSSCSCETVGFQGYRELRRRG